MNYENQKDCHLMTWETEPKKRNINNEIKFNISKLSVVEVGDVIKVKLPEDRFSCYEIIDIVDVKDSSIIKMNYITAKIKWYIK